MLINILFIFELININDSFAYYNSVPAIAALLINNPTSNYPK